MKIAIVDYDAGNLTSVKQALGRVGANSEIVSEPKGILEADRIVVPGVGHFGRTAVLAESGMQPAILQAINRGTPVLGICLGMQWLFRGSSEAPGIPGLGLLAEECGHFPSSVKSPHVGWNQLEIRTASSLFTGVSNCSFMYFTHSFRAPVTSQTCAVSEYGGDFSAAVEVARAFGVQFHPEKSGEAGLRVLKNFCDLPC